MDGTRIEAAARRIEAALARLAAIAERPPPSPSEGGVSRGEVEAALSDLDALIAELKP